MRVFFSPRGILAMYPMCPLVFSWPIPAILFCIRLYTVGYVCECDDVGHSYIIHLPTLSCHVVGPSQLVMWYLHDNAGDESKVTHCKCSLQAKHQPQSGALCCLRLGRMKYVKCFVALLAVLLHRAVPAVPVEEFLLEQSSQVTSIGVVHVCW